MDAATVFLQLVLSGVLVGSVYSLTAMGFVITYRTASVFNIAYGQFAVFGAFLAWTFLGSPQSPRFPMPVAIVLTLVSVIIFGLAGILPVLAGGSFLDYGYLAIPWVSGAELRSLGILIVEIGIGLAVFGTVVLIFDVLVGERW